MTIEVDSPSAARRLVDMRFREWGCESVCDVGELLVSELVTNAMMHAHEARPTVALRPTPPGVHVEVFDHSAVEPVAMDTGPTVPGGFGVQIVALLSSCWGVVMTEGGKAVWFELDCHAGCGERAHD